MRFLVDLLCVFALMAFAASAVAHSAGSAAIGSAMISQDGGMTDAAGCDACDVSQAGFSDMSCELVCNAGGLVAMRMPLAVAFLDRVAESHTVTPISTLAGISGPRLTQPPRFLL